MMSLISRWLPEPKSSHFVDVNKMVCDPLATHFAGGFRFADHESKVTPFRVAQQMLDVACQPILNASFCLLRMPLKVVGEGLDYFFLHAASPVLTLFSMAVNCTCTLSPIFLYGVHVGEFDKVPCARIVWLCIFWICFFSMAKSYDVFTPKPRAQRCG
jgi:hypothetical protein